VADFVLVEDVKAQANIPYGDTSNDFELHRYAKAAQEIVESVVGRVSQVTATETVTARGGVASLANTPILSVASVTSAGVAVTGYSRIDLYGMLTGVPDGDVTVTYTAGRDSTPFAVHVAGAIIAAHLWDTQRGNAPSALPGQDQFMSTPSGFAVPNRAAELLGPFILPPVVV
jgi:hypothetical protein